jgi:DNA-binding NtrC family response regulator
VNGSEVPIDNNQLVGVIDDQLSMRERFKHLFRLAGLNVETFASAEEFLTNARVEAFSCLVLEVQLPGISGLQLQQKLLISETNIPIIFLTCHADVGSAVRAVKSGAVEFLTKPFDEQYFLATVRSAITRRAVAKAPTAVGQIIGQGRAWRQIVNQIDIVAPIDAAVLVLGETGAGKELVACELHRRSRRRDKPLIRVNCACVPKDLFESEFFGHVRGAFTGALKDRIGRFEAAAGGTLFLDEVGEIPLELQSKLLRVLQEKSYERTGESKTRTADVRIVAATNRNLQEEVAAGRFREDLYYRLNVVPIKVPPLRDRKEDIPLLASHFIETTVREIRCPRPRLTRVGIDQLQNYDWPGNIRELCNAIQQAAILAQGGDLDFNLHVDGRKGRMNSRRWVDYGDFGAGHLTEAEMRQWKRQNLLVVLQKTGWKIKGIDGAAELLGVKPTTLISQIQRLGLRKPA